MHVDYAAPGVQTVSKEITDNIIKHHVWSSMGIGLLPLPLLDIVALTGIQIHLVNRLAEAYHLPFSKDRTRNILASLIGSIAPVLATPSIASLVKFVPFLGQTVGVVTMPILSGAATYAVGRVFVQHFASGGTFLTFDPDKVKNYYTEMFQEGKNVAAEIRQEIEEEQAVPPMITAQSATEHAPVTPATPITETKTGSSVPHDPEGKTHKKGKRTTPLKK